LIGKTGGTLQKYEDSNLTDPSGLEAQIEKVAKS
jgi:hypothetical protein